MFICNVYKFMKTIAGLWNEALYRYGHISAHSCHVLTECYSLSVYAMKILFVDVNVIEFIVSYSQLL